MEAWTTTVDRTVDHESPRVEADVLMHRGFDVYYLVKFPVVFWVELFYPPPPCFEPNPFPGTPLHCPGVLEVCWHIIMSPSRFVS